MKMGWNPDEVKFKPAGNKNTIKLNLTGKLDRIKLKLQNVEKHET